MATSAVNETAGTSTADHDPAYVAAYDRIDRIESAVAGISAEGAAGLSVKALMQLTSDLFADIARLVPELAPLVALALGDAAVSEP
jgi:hypothetical protein